MAVFYPEQHNNPMEDRLRIVQNAVRVHSTGEVHRSWHRHDFVGFETTEGSCFIDGGNDYVRCNFIGNPDVEWMSLYEIDTWRQFDKKLIVKMTSGPDRLLSSLTAKELVNVRIYEGMHPLSLRAIKRAKKRAGVTAKKTKKPVKKTKPAEKK